VVVVSYWFPYLIRNLDGSLATIDWQHKYGIFRGCLYLACIDQRGSLDRENKLAVSKNTLILLESSQYFEEEEYHYSKIDTLSRELKKCIVVKKVLTWLWVVKLSPQTYKIIHLMNVCYNSLQPIRVLEYQQNNFSLHFCPAYDLPIWLTY
jgi:hypothetical protein